MNPALDKRHQTLYVKGVVNLAVFCSGFGSNFQAIVDAICNKKLNARVAMMVCDNPKAVALRRAHKANIP